MPELKFDAFYRDYLEVLNAYRHAINTLYVDQNTVAPKKGHWDTNQVISVLSREMFQKQTDPEMIEKIHAYSLTLPKDSLERQEIELRLRQIDDVEHIPPEVYADFIKTKGDSEVTWHEAKEMSDYSHFRPLLEKLQNAQLDLLQYSPRYQPGHEYDWLLDMYERGVNEEKCDAFFTVVKEELVPFLEKIKKAEPIDTSRLNTPAPIEDQAAFNQEVLRYLQADMGRIYLSTTEHPFTDFISHDDARITTHYYPDRAISAILSTIHEYGHALFALQTDPAFSRTVFDDPGMAGHESQSRLMENHIGRSLAFWKALYPKFIKAFPSFKDIPVEEFVRMINAAKPGLIRTEADELTYPLHILIRYEIEKDMANRTLDYDKLPEIWADKYEAYLGVRPQNDKEGVLQDMHWSADNFGYFPTYALGSAYAAQIYEAMDKEIDVEKQLENSNFAAVAKWLEDHIHHYGGSRSMEEIVEEVSGKPFDPHVYTDYLKAKYSKLYHLDQEEKKEPAKAAQSQKTGKETASKAKPKAKTASQKTAKSTAAKTASKPKEASVSKKEKTTA